MTQRIMKAVIIEDEERSRIVLHNLLERYCPDVEVVESAEAVHEGVAAIRRHDPDVVFLDVQIAGGTGFDVLENVDEMSGAVIFTTAYDHYALKAFKFSAIDYLLKPIDIDELRQAVGRASNAKKSIRHHHQIRNLVSHFRHPDDDPVLLVTVPEAVEYVHIPDIFHCEAQESRTLLHLKNGKSVLLNKPVNEVEFLLQDYGFCRIHAAHIVNLKEVRKTGKSNTTVILRDGSQWPLATSRVSPFLEAYGKVSE